MSLSTENLCGRCRMTGLQIGSRYPPSHRLQPIILQQYTQRQVRQTPQPQTVTNHLHLQLVSHKGDQYHQRSLTLYRCQILKRKAVVRNSTGRLNIVGRPQNLLDAGLTSNRPNKAFNPGSNSFSSWAREIAIYLLLKLCNQRRSRLSIVGC